MPEGFEFLEHTADLKFRARGKTLEECFENSAKAMWHALIDPNSVDLRDERKVQIKAKELQRLMHDFLAELLFLLETQKILFREFRVSISRNNEYVLKARVKGERFQPRKHSLLAEIKAVTYHGMLIERIDSEWIAEVLCDI